MTVREIITVPHKILKRKARKVTDFGPDLQTLVEDMIETMREAPGVGLAAPQLNVSLRVLVAEYSDEVEGEEEPRPPKLYVFVNPEITRSSTDTTFGVEGCLSIPEFVGEVERKATVTIKGLDRRGKPRKLKAKGWLARIFQHEIDHLDGILFLDRAEEIYPVDEYEAAIAAEQAEAQRQEE